MKLIIKETYAELAKQAAKDLVTLVKPSAHPLVCVASGDSPTGLYKELIRRSKNGHPDIAEWNFIGLDEWVGLNGTDEGSCRDYLNRQLFQPLEVSRERIHCFDGKTKDLDAACRDMEDFIQHEDGLDAAILGLGMNGHIGLNEPGSSASSRSHITTLDPLTIKTAQKYFSGKQELSRGITLGLGTLLEAKHIFLLVSGEHKASILKKLIEGPVTEEVPATLLKDHPAFRIYVSADAAKLLTT